MSKLNEFISTIKTTGLAKTNRYTVFIQPPNELATYGFDMQLIVMFCSDVQLPGITMSTIQNRTFGEFREVPYEKLYENITMTFYVDKTMKVKEFFDKWMEHVQDPNSRTFRYYRDYISQMEIVVEDSEDNVRYTVQLEECYPKSVANVSMSYDSKNEMKLQVNMMYKSFSSFRSDSEDTTGTATWTDALGEPSSESWNSNLNEYKDSFTDYQNKFNEFVSEKQGSFTGTTIGKYVGII